MFQELHNQDDQAMFDELNLIPQSEEDRQQLIKILRFLLHYPSNKLANIHSKATRLGKFDEKKYREELKKQYIQKAEVYSLCECCYCIVQTKRLGQCTSIKKVATLGEATKLFFNDMKYAIFMMIVGFLIYGLYSIITNVIAANHNSNGCFRDKTCKLALIGIGSKLFATYSWENKYFYVGQVYLGLLMSISWAVLFFFKTIQQKKISMKQDKQSSTASDFSVMFINLQKTQNKQSLQSKLDSYSQTIKNSIIYPQQVGQEKYDGKFNIANFNPVRAYYQTLKLSERQEESLIEKKLSEAMQKLRYLITSRKGKSGFVLDKKQREALYREIDDLKVQVTGERINKLKIIQERYRRLQSDNQRVVFVTFTHTYARVNLLRLSNLSFFKKFRMCFGKTKRVNCLNMDGLIIERAPQPQDVVWENIGVSNRQVFVRKMFTYCITLILLGLSFTAIYGLSKAQEVNNNVTISLILSLVISIINIILNTIIQQLTIYQKDYTTTNYQISIAFKITVAQLINSIVISIIAARYIKHNIYRTAGLVDDVFYFALLNAFIPPLLRVVNAYWFFLRGLRLWFSLPNKKLYCQSQVEFNKRWQQPEFQIGLEYVYVLKTVIYTAFFISLQPIIVVFSFVGILLMYQAQKFALFYQSIRPKPSSDIITLSMNNLMYLSILAYGLGSLTWTNFLPHQQLRHTLVPNVLCIFVGLLLYLVSYSQMIGWFWNQNKASLSYEKQRIFLPSQYDRINPVTKSEGLKNFIKYLQQKRKIKKKMALASTKESSQDEQSEIGYKYLNHMMIKNKYECQFQENQMQDIIPHDIIKSNKQPEKLLNIDHIQRKTKQTNTLIKRSSLEVKSAIQKLQSIQPMETSNRLKADQQEIKIDTQHLKSIIVLNELPGHQRPSMLSARFNPIDFLQAIHKDNFDPRSQ